MNNRGFLRRPRALVAVSAVLFVIACAMPLQIMVLYGHGWAEWREIAAKLTSLNWLVMAGSALTAVLVFRASPHARLVTPALFYVVAVNNFFVGYLATDFSLFATTVSTLAFGLVLAPLYMGEAREVLLYPERRWWRMKARLPLRLPVDITGEGAVRISGFTHDISETGAFVPLSSLGEGLAGVVDIHLVCEGERILHLRARVVRRVEARGSYPAGVGVHFVNLGAFERRELKRLTRKSASITPLS